jgi:hypothetical protein
MPDAPREWTLAGRPKGKKKEQAPASRQCPTCFAVTAPLPTCPECGHEFVTAAREIEHVEGTLSEIDGDRLAALRTAPLRALLAEARDRDSLKEIARARGYKAGWVHHIMAERASRQEKAA